MLVLLMLLVSGSSAPAGAPSSREKKLRDLEEMLSDEFWAHFTPRNHVIPIIAVWPPINTGEVPASEQEARYLGKVFRRSIGKDPYVLVDSMHSTLMLEQAMPTSASHRAVNQADESDAAMAKRAQIAGAVASIRTWYGRRANGSLVIRVTVTKCGEEEPGYERTFEGSHDETDAAFGAAQPDLLRACGVPVDEAYAARARYRMMGPENLWRLVSEQLGDDENDGRRHATTPASKSTLIELAKAVPENPFYVNAAVEIRGDQGDPAAYSELKERLLAGAPDFAGLIGGVVPSSLRKLGRADLAMQYYEHLETVTGGQYAGGLLHAANAAGTSGDYALSLDWAKRAISLKPNLAYAHAFAGRVAMLHASNTIQQGRALDKLTKQELLAREKYLGKSLKHLTDALQLCPDSYFALSEMIGALSATGAPLAEIEAVFEKAMELDPDYDLSISSMAWTYSPGYYNDRKRGLALIRKWYSKIRDPQVAAEAMEPSLWIIFGDNPVYQDVYATVDETTVESLEVIRVALLSLPRQSTEGNLGLYLAAVLQSALDLPADGGQLDGLAAAAKSATYEDPEDISLLRLHLGRLFAMAGREEEARAHFKFVMSRKPDHLARQARAEWELSNARTSGNLDAAIKSLKELRAVLPEADFAIVEVLSSGTEAQKAEAFALARKVCDVRTTRRGLRALALAAIASGQGGKAVEAIDAAYPDAERLPPSLKPLRERAGATPK